MCVSVKNCLALFWILKTAQDAKQDGWMIYMRRIQSAFYRLKWLGSKLKGKEGRSSFISKDACVNVCFCQKLPCAFLVIEDCPGCQTKWLYDLHAKTIISILSVKVARVKAQGRSRARQF